ncbi:Hsp20/alpha crystallin family protein [Arthrobacter sp. AZCC_0090]|uniref:Hsp20/alpha crystallin family protein n=1 Tax=Arthrobacter sp. AZCC_0090 TaxID=2735881 RepID=UPI0016087E0D|nr:Hsp20/alpha crystallin family protein [Arthrobacter sp. AZCC_0090]MBB6402827.1 HSP20 family protein [Arthrobacter sp. AZCC_0090]
MDNFLRRSGLEVPEPVRRFLQGEADPSLRIEQYQEGDTLVVRIDLPGIDPETDVDISVDDDTLHIQARREENAEHVVKKGYRSELRYGERSRSITLPRGVSGDGILATYEDGVLEIRVQLPEQSESRTTKIRVVRTGGHEAGGHEENQSPEEPENYVT